MEYLLTTDHLRAAFKRKEKNMVAVDDVSFHLKSGKTTCIVGESGCGKSVTALSIMRLLGKNGFVCGGSIVFNGIDLLNLSEKRMRELRGNQLAMIFQEPLTSLNPLLTIGFQIEEAERLHLHMGKSDARARSIEMLKKVGIPDAEMVVGQYPHMLSGGMRQRVMIAAALSCSPKLLIADEPTTALDVTIQAQILRLIREAQKETGLSVLLITHDLGVVAEMADDVLVMYAGQVVEKADVYEIFRKPRHPYTMGLMNSIPGIEPEAGGRLRQIKGNVPYLYQTIKGCRFHDRCPYAADRCRKTPPDLFPLGKDHSSRCWLQETPEERGCG